jgi:hypothetical protein
MHLAGRQFVCQRQPSTEELSMNSIKLASIGLAATLTAILPVIPAQALVARAFLSAAGSDSNNCANVLTPCRHLATAFAATAPDGEIYVLDPANYGSLTITHGVSIEGHGWASIAPVANGNAITINANPGDKINIIGVVLDGTALANTNGIVFNSGGTLNVQDSVIRNFLGDGIFFHQNSSSPSQLFVSNTLISDNGGDGIRAFPSGTGTVSGVLDHVKTQNNVGCGIKVATNSQTMNFTISDSVSTNNQQAGVFTNAAGGTVNVMVRNSTIANNGTNGLDAEGAVITIRVTRSTITGNAAGWYAASGVVLSYGDNNIDGNGAANTEPPNPLVYH